MNYKIKFKCPECNSIFDRSPAKVLTEDRTTLCPNCSSREKGYQISDRTREIRNTDEYKKKISEARSYPIEHWINMVQEGFTFISKTDNRDNIIVECNECKTQRRINTGQVRSQRINCNRCNPWGSVAEVELLKYCRDIYPSATKKSHSQESAYELDIYIPELKIAFEYNRSILAL